MGSFPKIEIDPHFFVQFVSVEGQLTPQVYPCPSTETRIGKQKIQTANRFKEKKFGIHCFKFLGT